MKSIYQSILDLPREQWDYYYEIDQSNQMAMPFDNATSYTEFIRNYFQRGGKVNVFQTSGINVEKLHRPNHICSVFFLGLLVYYGTSLHEKYPLGKNKPGYDKFPFIWFLIALFHDNAYSIEQDNSLSEIRTLTGLKRHFHIDHDLLKLRVSSCSHLANSRNKYFRYCRKHRNCLDHGIVGGMLLYDRLIKIRRKKQTDDSPDEQLYWHKSLEADYRQAGNAISLHNIWLPGPDDQDLYKAFGLKELIGAPQSGIADFPLYYILAVVDTIEPLKEFMSDHADDFILKQLQINLRPNGISIDNPLSSSLNINRIQNKARSLPDWLAIKVQLRDKGFDLDFQ